MDIRIIAATNRDLRQLMQEDKFRADLYFHLNVARIHLLPLRERREDIPALLLHYLDQQRQRFGLNVHEFAEETLAELVRYNWPGNVRELKNLVEALAIVPPVGRIRLEDLPREFLGQLRSTAVPPQDERARILSALLATNWKRGEAAQKLHWSRMTLYRKMTKYHLAQETGTRNKAQNR